MNIHIHKKLSLISRLLVLLLVAAAWIFSLWTSKVQFPYIWINLVLTALIAVLLFWDFRFPKIPGIAVTLLVPIAAFYLLESYTHNVFEMLFRIQLLNIIVYALIFAIILFAAGKAGIAVKIFPMLCMLVGLINYYVIQFRSSPILPWDLVSAGIALSVAAEYTLKLPARILMISLLFVLLSVLASRSAWQIRGLRWRLIFTAAGVLLTVAGTYGVQMKSVGTFFKLDDVLFTPLTLYRNNGFAVSFMVNLQYLKIEAPKGYRVQRLQEIAETLPEDGGAAQYPNIIVIMNESFADPAAAAEFETNTDYMPFMHSLQAGAENTVAGQLLVSVCGGNTANSEYEFLTGNSMSLLPEGSIAYQQYISSAVPSLAWQLKGYGYETFGMHPYYASGWDRDEVYPYLGFDRVRFKEQMEGAGLLRQYISDEATYEMIREAYAQKGEQPLFTFEVTMQNHGGYFKDYVNFDREVWLLDVPENNDKTIMDRYLSLVKKSDEAFEKLVEDFKDYDEPTIILMFGDHQPGDYAIKAVYQHSEDSDLETLQRRYIVPFAIWANYDIEEAAVDCISVNYLSTLLLETAGVPLSDYQKFLSAMRQEVPAMNANGLIGSDGRHYSWSEAMAQSDLLKDYEYMQYNLLFDDKNRCDAFFGIDFELPVD